MTTKIEADPNQLVLHYRGRLEESNHNNLLLELALQSLQAENAQLRTQLDERDQALEAAKAQQPSVWGNSPTQ